MLSAVSRYDYRSNLMKTRSFIVTKSWNLPQEISVPKWLEIYQILDKHQNLSVHCVYLLIIQEIRANQDYDEGKFTNQTQVHQQRR